MITAFVMKELSILSVSHYIKGGRKGQICSFNLCVHSLLLVETHTLTGHVGKMLEL